MRNAINHEKIAFDYMDSTLSVCDSLIDKALIERLLQKEEVAAQIIHFQLEKDLNYFVEKEYSREVSSITIQIILKKLYRIRIDTELHKFVRDFNQKNQNLSIRGTVLDLNKGSNSLKYTFKFRTPRFKESL